MTGLPRLHPHVHLACCSHMHTLCTLSPNPRPHRAYYAASTLGGLTHADQRITEDVEKFCYSISELYAHTFKVRPDAAGGSAAPALNGRGEGGGAGCCSISTRC